MKTLLLFLALFAPLSAFAQTRAATVNATTGALIVPTASVFRSANGLAIGTDVQAYNASLAAIAGNTSTTLSLGNVTLTLAGLSTTPLAAANLTGSIAAARLPANLQSYNSLSSSGFVANLAGGSVQRTFQVSGSGISWTQGANGNADPTIALSSGLSALAANTSTGLSPIFTNVTSPTLTISGGTVSTVITKGFGTGGQELELAFRANESGRAGFFFQNLNTAGYPGFSIRNSSGNEKGAFAFGGGGTAANLPFIGRLFIETSDAFGGGNAPEFVLVQSTTYNGALGYGIHPRLQLDQDGSLIWYKRATNGDQMTRGFSTMIIDKALPILTLGTEDNSGESYGQIQVINSTFSVVLREGQTNKNSYYCYGGNLVDGLGHKFYTGGLHDAQTLRLHVADDFVLSSVPVVAAAGVRQGSSTGPLWTSGSGTPEAAVTAPVGSLFSRTDGGASTSFYVKESGSGNTGWVAK